MTNKCYLCWHNTLVFVWSTSRAIDKEKLGVMEQFKSIVNLERIGFPVCVACVKKYDLLEAKNEIRKI